MVRPVPIVVGKKPDEMKDKEDFYKIVEIVPGEQTMEPLKDTGCKMPGYGA